ncbi:MAG: AAA family ATPase [Candidatus Hermodarchaeota archaeon]
MDESKLNYNKKTRDIKRKVLAICGLPGSGKSTAIKAIEDLGIVVTMGDIVRNETNKRNLKPTRNNIGKIATELRKTGGPAIIADKCVDLIKDLNEEVIFVDGIRSLSEVNIFRQYWKFPIVAIVVDEKRRFKRLISRGRSDDPKTLEDLKERDKREINFGLDKVIEIANYMILNNSTIKDLKKKTRKVVIEIINTY